LQNGLNYLFPLVLWRLMLLLIWYIVTFRDPLPFPRAGYIQVYILLSSLIIIHALLRHISCQLNLKWHLLLYFFIKKWSKISLIWA
jgi:membrane protein YdbS with pleckstrin-like domain